MKYLPLLFFFITFVAYPQNSSHIHIDQFGYYPAMAKIAIISDPQIGFNASDSYSPGLELQVVNVASGQVVFSGQPIVWNNGQTDQHSGDRGWQFDFSNVLEEGEYYILDPSTNEQSHTFRIHNEVYKDVMKTTARMFYYNRCGTDKPSQFAGANWVDGVSFNNANQDQNCSYINDPSNTALQKDLSGGWYDAGDYNKYVTFTESTLHDLLSAFEENPAFFSDDWDLPESGNGIPDLLDEIKWELDWMLKMCNSDGSVHIKMGSQNYAENVLSPPSLNQDPRFYGPTCSSASIAVASTFAHAAIVFETIPEQSAYAAQLASQAEACYSYALNLFNSGSLEENCDDLSIVSGDADRTITEQTNSMVIASLYLFEYTGNVGYEQFFISQGILTDPLFNDYWDGYNLSLSEALLRYTTFQNPDPSMVAEIENSFNSAVTNNWNDFFGMDDLTLYRDFMPDWSYHWGSNSTKAAYGQLNILASKYSSNANWHEDQQTRAAAMLQSMHGVNPLGLVYFSNMSSFGAENSIQELYHTWFYDQTDYDNATQSLYGPAPGFLVGGPNALFSVASLSPPYGEPNQKAYLDFNTGFPDNSWELSEPGIYYQAAYIRLLTSVMAAYNDPFANVNELSVSTPLDVEIYPNPTNSEFTISAVNSELVEVKVLDCQGRLVENISEIFSKSFSYELEGESGVYIVTALLKNGVRTTQYVVLD